jgi:hypothetical protein
MRLSEWLALHFGCFKPLVKEFQYPLNRRLQAPQRHSGHLRVKKNLLTLLAVELRFLYHHLFSVISYNTLAQINEIFNFKIREFFFYCCMLLDSFYVSARNL